MKHLLSNCLIAAMTLATPFASHAHRSFLVPSSTILSGDKHQFVSVDAARGNDLFYFNHNAMPVEGLIISAPDGSVTAPAKLERFRHRNVFEWPVTQAGTWRAAVVDEGLRATWEANGVAQRWAGPRADFVGKVPAGATKVSVADVASRVEVFVTSGKPTAPARIGRGMEVVYQPHPNDLAEGETAVLTFLVEGQPAADLAVQIVQGGGRYRNAVVDLKLKTDSAGKVSVTWPAPGMYWIAASQRKQQVAPPADRGSVSYAATVEVMPK